MGFKVYDLAYNIFHLLQIVMCVGKTISEHSDSMKMLRLSMRKLIIIEAKQLSFGIFWTGGDKNMKQIWNIPKGRQVKITNKDSKHYNKTGVIIDKYLNFDKGTQFEYLVKLSTGSKIWFKNIEVKLVGNHEIVNGRIVILPDRNKNSENEESNLPLQSC